MTRVQSVNKIDMYHHIFARSFSKNEQKRFGNWAFVVCFIVALSFCTLLRPTFHLSMLNLEMWTNRSLDMLTVKTNNQSTIPKRMRTMSQTKTTNITSTTHISRPRSSNNSSIVLSAGKQNYSPKPSHPTVPETKNNQATCNCASNQCEIRGQARIDGKSSTVFIVSSNRNNLATDNSWGIRPYSRKGSVAIDSVRKWTVKTVDPRRETPPTCTKTHTDPAVLFSTAGFSGNHFHDFSDTVIPLFTSSRAFDGKVHLLVTNFARWWVSKFHRLLDRLSDHDIVDVDNQEGVHCYENVFIGLNSHKELGIDVSKSPNGYSMTDFRHFLRSTYSLARKTATKLSTAGNRKPRLMILTRRRTRRLTNEGKITRAAERVGYDVVLGDANLSTNLTSFAGLVNSCDVLVGVHGAGLTNMVFLPDHAVVVQVVPLGGIERFAEMDFGLPSRDMKLRYLSYSIRVRESSLVREYGAEDVVLRDPMALHRQGWDEIRRIYLEKQDIEIDVRRFRSTLLKAKKLLHH